MRKEREDRGIETVAAAVAGHAEELYGSGRMHCAEAVLASVQHEFAPELPADLVRYAAGFGGGSGVGCICGAVAGGTMALGVVLGGDRKTAAALTRELHGWFKGIYPATCCRALSAKGKGGCAALTGRVAGKVSEMLAERR